MDGGANVQVDQLELLRQIGIAGELAALADAGVQGERIDGPAGSLDVVIELLHALGAGEIRLDNLNVGLLVADLPLGCAQVVLGVDEQIEAVLGEDLGELVPDAARGTRDDCKWSCRGCVHQTSSRHSVTSATARQT